VSVFYRHGLKWIRLDYVDSQLKLLFQAWSNISCTTSNVRCTVDLTVLRFFLNSQEFTSNVPEMLQTFGQEFKLFICFDF
jgi:hypothetical protein